MMPLPAARSADTLKAVLVAQNTGGQKVLSPRLDRVPTPRVHRHKRNLQRSNVIMIRQWEAQCVNEAEDQPFMHDTASGHTTLLA